MIDLYKGYVPTKDKQCQMKFKNAKSEDLLAYDQVKDLPEYAGILAPETILIDVDDSEQSEILMNIVDDKQLNCRVIDATRGKHFLFKNTDIDQCYTHVHLACGITADIKVGVKNSYEVLKFNNEERFVEWDIDEEQDYQEVPKWLNPVRSKMDFLDMKTGDGRNNALFGYILTLQSAGFDKEEARTAIRILNKYVLKDPLSADELEVILRDEAFAKPVFYKENKFLHSEFGNYLKSEYYIKRINGQLHIYTNGAYQSGYRFIENKMIQLIPDIKATQRTEVLKYLESITLDDTEMSSSDLIPFRNGVLNWRTKELLNPSPEYILTNKIPWDWNPNAYDPLADKVLNKIACQDKEIRALLEECIGYCFFRQNEASKAFMLTGLGSNGKSTYLDMVKNVLGRQNYVALDIDEMAEKFSTATLAGKLADIADDISDEFLQGKAVAQFKKIVSGNDIKAENKGQDVFFFRPTVKLLMSANEIPRFRNKGFDAIKRRLIIVPFNATFTDKDPDYDPQIAYKLKKQSAAEYLIRLGVEALGRIKEGSNFTESTKVHQMMDEFDEDNSPVRMFLESVEDSEILNHETREVYLRFSTFCTESGYQTVTIQSFSKEITKRLDCQIINKKIQGRKCRIFMEKKL